MLLIRPIARLRGAIPLLTILIISLLMATAVVAADAERWEESIRAFEEADRANPPAKGGIVFVGSSSVRRWRLDDYFADFPVLNRGFGGSQMADSVRYADRIVVPYQPKLVVVYAGDNDINAGKNPEQVLADYEAFVATIHQALPKTRIAFIAIKPSLRRWDLVDKMRQANGMVRAVAGKDPRLDYIDVDTPMIGADGKPRPELFAKDGLHLSDEGNALWASLVRPFLKLE